MQQSWRALICTYLLSPKVSFKFYAVYPINIGIIDNIVNSHCGGEQKISAMEGLVSKQKDSNINYWRGPRAVKI